jgi:hypothetical protein
MTVVGGFFVSHPVLAASLYLDPASSTLFRSDAVSVAVRVDVDEAAGECINAADVVITYDPSVQPVDVSRGDSIFSLWVEEPVIDAENRQITFAGGIPNGYCGRIPGDPRLSNVLAEIVFRSPGLQIGGGEAANQAVVTVDPSSIVYLNDGQGTQAPLQTFSARINLERQAGSEIIDPWRGEVQADVIPPQEFSISLEQDEVAFNGEYFIVFNTSDKETGISHYEVIEEPVSQWGLFTWGAVTAPWQRARSPYVLTDQSLNSIIRVRAIDKAGNEYIATLVPDESRRSLSAQMMLNYVLLSAGILLLLVVVIVIVLWSRRRIRKKAVESARDDTTNPEDHA